MQTITLTVKRPTVTGKDPYDQDIITYQDELISGVLIAPAQTDDNLGEIRPDGAKVIYTLHIPKTYTGSLDGCLVCIGDETLKVIGKPRRLMQENTPTAWNMTVEVGWFYG